MFSLRALLSRSAKNISYSFIQLEVMGLGKHMDGMIHQEPNFGHDNVELLQSLTLFKVQK